MSVLQDVVAEAISRELEFAYNDEGTPYHPHVPHMAGDVVNALRDSLTITTREQLDALPALSVVWFHVTYDSVRYFSLLSKDHDGNWFDATNPDHDHRYTPLLPCHLLWTEESL